MPVSRQGQHAFVHIPKTGGTSIEAALGLLHDWREENRGAMFGLIQSPDLKEHGFVSHFLQHLTVRELALLIPDIHSFFVFSFVRNPWQRFVSTYANTDPHLCRQAEKQGIQLTGISFKEFVYRCKEIEHVHLLEQYKFIMDSQEKVQVDFIGHFESLEEDFQRVCQRLGVVKTLPHLNQSAHRSYRRYYDEETRAIIAERYRADIELFGYTF